MQGAFILLGNNTFGYPLLVVMAISVYMYVCWRFWEGITGQGSDDAFGPFKNFFKYRLSPVVSVSTVLNDTLQFCLLMLLGTAAIVWCTAPLDITVYLAYAKRHRRSMQIE